MSAIHQALGRLFDSIENLEGAAAGQARALKQMQQQDLFNRMATSKQADALIKVDPALLAKKLDGAIMKIEQVLNEGRA
ncbi:MAG: hypothetical protein HY370_05745 [Proteobacteria bacterium]|nr:hypothetical protein [Pseudomonadota bacterium]